MGVFDWLFQRRPKPVGKYEGEFKMLDGYRPHFTAWNKDIYENELIRAETSSLRGSRASLTSSGVALLLDLYSW